MSSYVEPFAGSLAVLLGNPEVPRVETVNDLDGFICNFWRSIKSDPDAVAAAADWPVNEVDLHARHAWLVTQRVDLTERLMGDPDFYDAKIAGWWVWGVCAWIGTGWCSGKGPWQSIDGRFVKMGDLGRGVNRQLPHLGNLGRGVNRQLPHLGNLGRGVRDGFAALSVRLRRVRVACGDWARVMGPSVLRPSRCGIAGVVLDPPYSEDLHAVNYAVSTRNVSADVAQWAIEHGDDPNLRIALCGYYDGEHEMPSTWECVAWKTTGGYGSQGTGRGRSNRHRERVWFSPHCLRSSVDAEEVEVVRRGMPPLDQVIRRGMP